MADLEIPRVDEPIAGDASGKNLLSMHQLTESDIWDYIEEARAADVLIEDPSRGGIDLLRFKVLKAVMRQPSTRTAGSMTSAMWMLGGGADLISGMASSSEAKGESIADSWVAFATQAHIIGTRTEDKGGPALAAESIALAHKTGHLSRSVPIINLGDGKNEHPTQALGDLFTIQKALPDRGFDELTLAIVGDHERYRAHHSLIIGAAAVGMNVITVESEAAPVPEELVKLLGTKKLTRTGDLDAAMRQADVLYMGRSPDEYTGKEDPREIARSEQLTEAYGHWKVDLDRLQKMRPDGIVLHPRPRQKELDSSVDADPRLKDIKQMENMIPMRMAIIARHMGKSIKEKV